MKYAAYVLSIGIVWGLSTFGAITMGIGEIYLGAVAGTIILSIAYATMD